MWKFSIELLSYSSFVCVLYLISYANHTYDEYHQVRHLRRLLLSPQNETNNFSQIQTTDEYWKWLKEIFVTNISPNTSYVDDTYNSSRTYLGDNVNLLLGWATVRQLRVRPDTCQTKSSIRNLVPGCYDEYTFSNEDTRSYSPGWTMNTTENYTAAITNAFIYQTSKELDTYFFIAEHGTYGGGGYVYEFRSSLSQISDDLAQLHQLGWIDRQTRAVIIRMSLYNPSVPLFTSATIIAELLPTSGVFTSARFEPLDFDAFKSTYQLVLACIYFVFIVYFMIVEIRAFIRFKRKYFFHFWSYIEFAIIACSWANVGVHLIRSKEASRLTKLFHETHGNVIVNFQLITYFNDIFSFILGFCCFFGLLKLLRLCQYSARLALLSNTLKRAAPEIFSFSLMFSIIFMAFLTLFYLQFVAYILDCSTLLHTAQMLFEMLLLKFDTREIIASAPLLGPIYFTLFILFVVFICINMFVSIINDNFRIVRADIQKYQYDNHDILINLILQLKQWFGTKQEPATFEEYSQSIRQLAKQLDALTRYAKQRYDRRETRIP